MLVLQMENIFFTLKLEYDPNTLRLQTFRKAAQNLIILSLLLNNIFFKDINTKQYHKAKFPDHLHSGSLGNRTSFQFCVTWETKQFKGFFFFRNSLMGGLQLMCMHFMMKNVFNRFVNYLNLPLICNIPLFFQLMFFIFLPENYLDN